MADKLLCAVKSLDCGKCKMGNVIAHRVAEAMVEQKKNGLAAQLALNGSISAAGMGTV